MTRAGNALQGVVPMEVGEGMFETGDEGGEQGRKGSILRERPGVAGGGVGGLSGSSCSAWRAAKYVPISPRAGGRYMSAPSYLLRMC